MKREKKNKSAPVDATAADTNAATETVTVETENVTVSVETTTPPTDEAPAEVTEEVTAEPVVADDVLAILAGDDADEQVPDGSTDEAPAATDEVEADDPTDAEVLATINAAGSASSKPGTPKQPKADPVIMRDFTAVAQIDRATLDQNLAGINAKKVREKADNLIAAVQSGKKLSNYTKLAVKELVKNGAISGKDMVAAYLDAGLKEGTARAQAQQMTALFKVVGAVVPDASQKGRLVANDPALISELEKLAA